MGEIGSRGGSFGGYRTSDLRREDFLDRVLVWVQELAEMWRTVAASCVIVVLLN